ncbi:MAG: hypothetical protein JW744_02060 [Candidatus Diapherotrites archaeon]|uniref:Uncharacterized protein n=1 Tax=Candidatus Iainarchaeum sp. TaxID=3101447 RepID=A0A938YU72_9ARCH|nr:hypothetical protein [Candidatus Diapherotrites archaeon]
MSAIKPFRYIAFLIAIPATLVLLPFSVFLFFKFKKIFGRLRDNVLKQDFLDLKTDLSAAEVEYASNKIHLQGFPTKHGFIGELLKLNHSKAVSLDFIGNKLLVKKIASNEAPSFLQKTNAKEMFEEWKAGAEKIGSLFFILGGNFVLKASFWALAGINFLLTFFLAFLFIFFLFLVAPPPTILIFKRVDFLGTVLSAFFIFAVIANIALFAIYALWKMSRYEGKEEGVKKMMYEYQKSVLLNAILNRLVEGRFDEETSLNYFLMYGEYGAFAIASHAAKKLDLELIEIMVE